jgi:hypothetical protein
VPDDSFAYRGPWSLDYQGATADSDTSAIELNYHAKNVYLVAGGTGTVTATRDGKSTAIPIAGLPTLHQIVAAEQVGRAVVEVRFTQGLQRFSFTYGWGRRPPGPTGPRWPLSSRSRCPAR